MYLMARYEAVQLNGEEVVGGTAGQDARQQQEQLQGRGGVQYMFRIYYTQYYC